MTNDERDRLIMETHDAVIGLIPKVADHDMTLYGNGKPGLKEEVIILKQEKETCPARKAFTEGERNITLNKVAVLISIVAIISSTVLGIIALK